MRTVRLLSILLASLVVCQASTALASAGAVRALTKAEYQQLQIAQHRIHSLESSDARSFEEANAVCTRLRDVSRLITAVRTGCLDLIRLGGDDNRLNARATKCGIDPASEAAILTCLVPAAQAYYTDAEAFYRAQTYVNQLARARGFRSSCVAVIGDSPANIAAEGRLANDLKTAVKALSDQNAQALATLSNAIQADIKAIKPGPHSLSLCPHA
jgi:hypothetical protein